MRFSTRKDLAISVPLVAAALFLHILVTLGVVRLSAQWLGGLAIAVLIVAVTAVHVVGFRRLATRRDR